MRRGTRALTAAGAALVAGVLSGAMLLVARRPTDAEARILFTGDILLARQVEVEHRLTGRSPWDSLSALFAQADWIGGNLEGAIGEGALCVTRAGAPCFAFPSDAATRLAAARFDAVTVENNHATDLGARGRDVTLRALAAAGVMPVNFRASPRFTRVRDLTLGVVAITLVPGADGRAQTIPSIEVEQRLRLAASLANVVVVSIHWGTELRDWPDSSQRAMAAWLVAHGADLVVGHHPHVVQRPECVHGHPVFFSLGNHVFDQKYAATKQGMIADCEVRGGHLYCTGRPTRTRVGSAMPVPMPASDTPDMMLAGCTPAVRTHLVVAGWTLRPVPWSRSDDVDGHVAIEGTRAGARGWRTRPVSLVTLDTGLVDGGGRPLLLALERHPSPMDGEVAIRPHVYAVTDHGLAARWRGTALAWPLLDASVEEDGTLCALHRGDSFVRLNAGSQTTRTMRYQWNGFGFTAALAVHRAGRCSAPGDR